MRALGLLGVLLGVLVFLGVIMGASGVSDKLLTGIVIEVTRAQEEHLSRQIRDPEVLRQTVNALRADIERTLGLDQPWYVRIPEMIRRVLILDLGISRGTASFGGSNKIADIVLERLPNTIVLLTTATALLFVVGIPVGTKIATMVGSRLDRALSYFSAVSYAVPGWWLGIILILLLGFYARIFPFGGLYSTPPPTDGVLRALDVLWHATLPVITLLLAGVGVTIYVTRTLVLNTAQEDFVTVARAEGLPENLVMRKYILRAAAPPILTNVILGLVGSLGGAILTETVFTWPGIGLLFYEAILRFDEAMVIALTFMFTLLYVAARFSLEIIYVLLDPRVRY